MRAVTAAAVVLITLPAVFACGKKAREGLPPAENWDQLQSAGAMVSLEQIQRPRAMGDRAADPHAGVPGAPPIGMGGGDPHAGMDMGGGDPHAGMNMGGGDPHAGMNMGGGDPHGGGGMDVTQLGIPAPDPNRKIDPSRRVKGTIRVGGAAKGKVPANGTLFVVVKRAGADGQPTGMALAVEKLSWAGDSLSFELTEANAMAAGTELTGDVIVSVRYDQDSDAISRQPGDVTGQVRAKIPADKLELLLDTVLP